MPTSRGFTEFAERVRLRAAEHYNYNFSADEEVNFFIGAFYDGVVLLGMALNETLVEGGDIMDGVAVTRRMWNREFEGQCCHRFSSGFSQNHVTVTVWSCVASLESRKFCHTFSLMFEIWHVKLDSSLRTPGTNFIINDNAQR